MTEEFKIGDVVRLKKEAKSLYLRHGIHYTVTHIQRSTNGSIDIVCLHKDNNSSWIFPNKIERVFKFRLGDIVILINENYPRIGFRNGDLLSISKIHDDSDWELPYFCKFVNPKSGFEDFGQWVKEDMLSMVDYEINLKENIPEVIKNKIDYINKNILNEN